MSRLLPFASEPHDVWFPLAREIHTVVWDNVGLPRLQELVRQWAAEWYQRQRASRDKAVDDWKRKPPKEEDYWAEARVEVSEFKKPTETSEEYRRRAKERVEAIVPARPFGPVYPSDPLLPLPPDHGVRSLVEKVASLAAIHDVYWTDGEKVNPWPEPVDDKDYPAWMEAVEAFEGLMKQAAQLDKGHAGVVTRWLKDVRETCGRLPGDDAADKIPQPKPDYFRAYWAHQAGMTQAAIAERLDTNQGQVSRMIARVNRWLAEGNKMPEIHAPEPLHEKPLSVDPDKLDLGPRSEHRTPRQREKLAASLAHDDPE